jgi:hypothetical protein
LRKEVETCGLCHARRAEFSERGSRFREGFIDYNEIYLTSRPVPAIPQANAGRDWCQREMHEGPASIA